MPEDNFAERIDGTYKLDKRKFLEILTTLCASLQEVRKTSEAGTEAVKPGLVPCFGRGGILIGGEYHTDDESGFVRYTHVGRLIGGGEIERSPDSLYLQTFNHTDPDVIVVLGDAKVTSNPDLTSLLSEYIVK